MLMFGRRWDPWNELEGFGSHMRRIQDEMNTLLSRFDTRPSGEFPSLNVWTKDDEAVITTELPDIEPKNIDITVSGNTFTVKGTQGTPEPGGNESYHRRERWNGNFSRSLDLTFTVDTDKVTANFKKGVLYVTLPRHEAEKPRKISISA